ncbi:MAG: hypothetical protein ACTH1D_08405 [Mycobacteriaceae bacterium]
MSNSPIADLSDNLLAWASSTELDLAGRLGELPGDSGDMPAVFVDLDTSGDELDRITTYYGTFLARQISAGADEDSLLRMCPALTATTLLFRAARLNVVGELESEFWTGLGLEPTGERVALVDYREILTRAGLDPMDAAAAGSDGDKGRLFAHVGIATDWVPELIELIDSRRLDGEAVADQAGEARAVVDILAEESLQAGPLCAALPELAVRLITPVVEVVRLAGENPDRWRSTLADAGDSARVAPLVLEDVVEELRERPAGTTARRHRVGVGTREDLPRLALDRVRHRIVLRLPEQPLDSDGDAGPSRTEVRWHVDVEGRPAGFRTRLSEAPGRPVTNILDVPVRRPVREIGVRDLSHSESWVLPVVDESDPVLVFTRRGKDLTDRVSLHHSRVLVVCPSESTAVDPVRETELPVLGAWQVKAWDGWVIRELDLTGAVSLHIDRPGVQRPAMSSVRCVDARQRVRFREPEDVLPAVRTLGGLPVHSSSLRAVFPPTVSGAPEIWFLSVSSWAGPDETGEEVTEEEPLEVPAEGGMFDVFDPEAYDTPWVGEYLVRLRGPRNESFRHEFAIVEGLDVEAPATPRLGLASGLTPVTVTLHRGDKPLYIPRTVDIGAEEKTVQVIAETEAGDALPLVVEPPRLRFQLPLIGEDPLWRTERVTVAAVTIDPATRFRIRPGIPVESPRLVIRDHHGAPVRTLRLATVDQVTWSVALTSVTASLPQLTVGSCELEFVSDGRSHSVRLASMRPREDRTLALLPGEGDGATRLRSEPAVDAPAWVWPLTAPWLSARVVGFSGGVAELPAELVDAGALSVQPFNPDRFSRLHAPASPGPEAMRVESPGHARPDDGGPWTQLAAFLAGDTDELPEETDVLTALWDVLAGWLTGGATEDAGAAMHAALARHPREALRAMSRSLVTSSDRPAQFILSGLVHAPLRSTEPDRRPGVAWIAALETLGELAATDDEDTTARREIGRRLSSVGGAPLSQTVETGRDATLETSCIDATTVQIAHLAPEQQEALLETFFSGSQVVPGALSEENTRLIAVFETFRHREELGQVLADPGLLRVALALLRRIRQTNRQLYTSARVRFDKLDNVDTDNPDNRWALTPVISMILALAARMHAHGRLGSTGQLVSAYPGWAGIARIVPDLVTGDLVAADAMVLGVYGPDEVEEEDVADAADTAASTADAIDALVQE